MYLNPEIYQKLLKPYIRTICESDTFANLKLVDDVKVHTERYAKWTRYKFYQTYSLAMNVAIYIVGIISSIVLVIMGTYVTYQNVR